MLITLSVLAAIGLFVVMRRAWPKDPQWAAIVAGCIVLASSAYGLFTTPPDSLSFRVHVILILAMVVVIIVRSLRIRATR